jgi:hypothetical protein
VNIFKGARRIAAVLAICWVAGWVAAVFMTTASGSMIYHYAWPNEPPKLVDGDGCGADDASSFSHKYIGYGSVYLTLCFKGRPDGSEPMVAYAVQQDPSKKAGPEERYFIREMVELHPARRFEVEKAIDQVTASKDPSRDLKIAFALHEKYLQDSKAVTYISAKKFSPTINKYITATSSAFEIPEKDLPLAKARIWDARKRIMPIYGGIMAGGLVAGVVVMLAIGWIVRGFVGVPMGKDSKA